MEINTFNLTFKVEKLKGKKIYIFFNVASELKLCNIITSEKSERSFLPSMLPVHRDNKK